MTDGRTDGRTDRRTFVLLESLSRLKILRTIMKQTNGFTKFLFSDFKYLDEYSSFNNNNKDLICIYLILFTIVSHDDHQDFNK